MNKKCLFLLIVPLLLSGCNNTARKIDKRFTLANLGNDVSVHTELQEDYLYDEDYENVPSECNGLNEYSIPNTVKLTWEVSEDIESFIVGVGEKKDLSDQKEYLVEGKQELELYNLKIDTKYYWTVSEEGSELKSETASFVTSDLGPRNINIPGMTNCRDIGGYQTKDGKIVKQGLLYRTGNADNITDEGKKVAKELGIKTEIDLRDAGYKSSSPIGSDVDYYSYRMYYNDYANYLERNCEAVKSVFRVLADEESYPVMYHCRIGTDRTGFMTYLLLGLFGVYEEDIYRDYLFSNFGLIEEPRTLHGSGVNNVQLYYEAINDFPGENLQEKVYNFLIGIGLTEDEIDTVLEINVIKAEAILPGNRPIVIQAEDFGHSLGLEMQSYTNNDSKTTINYYQLSGNVDKSIMVDFTLLEDKEVDIYCYMYATSAALNIRACDALAINVEGEELFVTGKTFSNLHLRGTAGIYVCAKLTNELFAGGSRYNMTITNVAKGNNTTGLGVNIASVVIIPRDS